MSRRRIVVAMSGGIDSSVAAALLTDQGFEVVGVHMRVGPWGAEQASAAGRARACCSLRDAEDARSVAAVLGIPFYVLDFRADFEREVIAPFVETYRQGRTPNPCVLCNERLKLGRLLERAESFGACGVATGHYARVVLNEATGRHELRRGGDRARDQSYYLFRLSQEQLAAFHTPLGCLTKEDARRIARQRGLPVSEKPGSQDICFLADSDYRGFLAERLAQSAERDLGGAIVDRNGRELGRHEGVHLFTVGQRRGIGISGPRPLYVVELRPEERVVVVGEEQDLRASVLETGRVVWGAVPELDGVRRGRVQIRYRHQAAPATLIPIDGGRRVRVEFDSPQRAITPGQAAALYDEDDGVVLGGGWIERAL